jgi:hypothetical protein
MPIYDNTRYCVICGASNHKKKNCPQNYCTKCKVQGHRYSRCPHTTCFNCGLKGHIANICPTPKECEKCYSTKHSTNKCPHQDSDKTFIRRPTNKRLRIDPSTPQISNSMQDVEAQSVRDRAKFIPRKKNPPPKQRYSSAALSYECGI